MERRTHIDNHEMNFKFMEVSQSVLHEALRLIVIVIMMRALDVLGNCNCQSDVEKFVILVDIFISP